VTLIFLVVATLPLKNHTLTWEMLRIIILVLLLIGTVSALFTATEVSMYCFIF